MKRPRAADVVRRPPGAGVDGTEGRAEAAGPPAPPRWTLAIPGVLAVAVYLNTLGHAFVRDDHYLIEGNEAVHGLGRLGELLGSPLWSGVSPFLRGDHYRPVPSFVWALLWSAGDGAAWPYHAASVLLHAAASMLVALLLWRLARHAFAAAAGAALFAVHPLHTEAVAMASNTPELLAAVLVVGGCALYLDPRPRRGNSIAPLYGLALLAKENAAVLPGLLLALEAFAPTRPGSLWRRVLARRRVYIGCAVAIVAVVLLRWALLGRVSALAIGYIGALPTPMRLATAVSLWAEYARLLLWPVDLTIDYGPATILPVGADSAAFLAGAAVLVLLLLLLAAAWRRRPLVALGVTWFFLAVLPASNLIVPFGVWLAERTLYTPSVALSIALLPLLAGIDTTARRARTATLAAVVLLGALAWGTVLRNRDWHDDATLFGDLVERHPENAFAQLYVAGRLLERADFAAAEPWLLSAAELNRHDPHPSLLLAFVRLERRDVAGAAEALARVSEPQHPVAYMYRSERALLAAEPALALAEAKRGKALYPWYDPLLRQEARVWTALGVGDSAAALLRAADTLPPSSRELPLPMGPPPDLSAALRTGDGAAPVPSDASTAPEPGDPNTSEG